MRKSITRRLERLEAIKTREDIDTTPKVIEIVLVEPGERPGEISEVRTLTMNLKTGEQTWNPPIGEDDGNNQ